MDTQIYTCNSEIMLTKLETSNSQNYTGILRAGLMSTMIQGLRSCCCQDQCLTLELGVHTASWSWLKTIFHSSFV